MSENKLIIYSDFICPFCYIGKVNAERLQEQNPGMEIEWREFELHPEGQPDPNNAYMKQAYENVKMLAEKYDIDMKPEVLTDVTSESRKALLGFEYADEQGKGSDYREEVFKAYWLEARDINDEEVLQDIARTVGLDTNEFSQALRNDKYFNKLKSSIRDAHQSGITGVPTYVYGDYKTVGAQPVEQLQRMVDAQKEKDAIENPETGMSCGPDGC
ncbi:DsbA family protein [Pontibacillus salicampi]|uniref:DsbA family protein n=1 Tax=Pontibacillus salicampi TaxID=1449801 RepID=A0ABV6LKA4_9BACI